MLTNRLHSPNVWYLNTDVHEIAFIMNRGTSNFLYLPTVMKVLMEDQLRAMDKFISIADASAVYLKKDKPFYFTSLLFVNNNHWVLFIYDPKQKQAGIYDLHGVGFGSHHKTQIINHLIGQQVNASAHLLNLYDDDSSFCGAAVLLLLEALAKYPLPQLSDLTPEWLNSKMKLMGYCKEKQISTKEKLAVRYKHQAILNSKECQPILLKNVNAIKTCFFRGENDDALSSLNELYELTPFLYECLNDPGRAKQPFIQLQEAIDKYSHKIKNGERVDPTPIYTALSGLVIPFLMAKEPEKRIEEIPQETEVVSNADLITDVRKEMRNPTNWYFNLEVQNLANYFSLLSTNYYYVDQIESRNFELQKRRIKRLIHMVDNIQPLPAPPFYFTSLIFVNSDHWVLFMYDPRRKEAGIFDLHEYGYGHEHKVALLKEIQTANPNIKTTQLLLGVYNDEAFCGPAIGLLLEVVSKFPLAQLGDLTPTWFREQVTKLGYPITSQLSETQKLQVRERHFNLLKQIKDFDFYDAFKNKFSAEFVDDFDTLQCQEQEPSLTNAPIQDEAAPSDINLVKAYLNAPNAKTLQMIVDTIPAYHLSIIFANLKEYQTKQLQTAQHEIYQAIANSQKLKIYHWLRISLAVVIGASVVFSPLLLIMIPWIREKQNQNLLVKREVSEKEFNKMKKVRDTLKEPSENNNIMFNKSGELKAVKIRDSGKVTLFMNQYQAKRFDYLLEYSKKKKGKNSQLLSQTILKSRKQSADKIHIQGHQKSNVK